MESDAPAPLHFPLQKKYGCCVNFVKKLDLTNLESVPSAGIFLGPRPGVGISGPAWPDRAAARPLPAAPGRGGRPTQKHKAEIIAVIKRSSSNQDLENGTTGVCEINAHRNPVNS